jgi:uncharacterized protein YhaN
VRLHRLELTTYGAFSSRAVEIGPGLTVIHGPNESGKSTLSHAIGDLLWGLQSRQHPYAFLVNPSQLRLTATVTKWSNPTDELTLTVDSRGCRDSDDVAVTPWWRTGTAATRDAWNTALGLDLTELRSGGHSVLDDGGDLASLLFRARTGVDVTQVLKTLTTRAEAAYKRRANTKGPIRTLLADAKRTRQDTADVTSSAANVERLRGEAARLETLSKAATDEFRKQEVAHSAAQEAQRAWEPAANLAAARDRQIQLHALGRVLDATDLDAYAQARRELTPLTGQLAEVNEELATLGRRVGELLVDDAALGLAPNVDDLQTRQELEKRRGVELTERRSGLADVREEMRRVAASLAPRSWDDASASASADALRATTSQLLIPVDVADRIHRGARDVFDIEKEILTETDEVATVRERLTDLDPGLGNPGVSSGVRESRGVRDQAWAEIKEPWLSGALPDDQTRVQLAGAVDARTRDADEASDHATIDAENTGRVLEVNAQLADRILHLNELRGVRDGALAAWANLLTQAGIPSVVDPGAWEVRWAAIEELAGLLHEEHELMTTVTTDEQAEAAYATDVLAVGDQLGISGNDTWGVLSDAVEHVTDSRKNQAAVKALRESLDKATRKREGLTLALAGHEAVIARLQADDDLEEVVARSREVARERERESTSLDQIRLAARTKTDLEGLVTRLAGLDAVDLAAKEIEAKTTLDEAFNARDAARDALAEAQRSLRAAERIGDAATMHAREIEAAEVLAADVAEYVQTRVMITALSRLLTAEEPDHDTALLIHASNLASRLTEGRVTGLTVEDRAGKHRLRIEADGLGEGVPAELSDGTADQVYLALRLAGIRQMQMRAVTNGVSTLPVVLDDILVTHDDGRTAVALEVLADEARDQQILLMTHHSAVAEAARLTSATVVKLAPLAQLSVTTPAGH